MPERYEHGARAGKRGKPSGRIWSVALAGGLIGALALTSRAAAADRPTPRNRAKALLIEGADLYRKRDLAGAMARFKAAYQAYPSPKIYYNYGLVYEAMGKSAQAAAEYERFLRGAQDAQPENIADAKERLQRLAKLIGYLTLSSDAGNADVFLDGMPIGKVADLGKRPVDVGRHDLVARSRQLGSQSRTFFVQAGQVLSLQLQLRAEGQAPAPARAEPGQDPDAAAEQLVVKGVELRKQRKHLEAYDLFRQAYQMSPRPRPSAQLGLVEYQLGKWVDAEAHLEQALQTRDDPFIRANLATIDEALSVVRSHIGFVTVTGTPPGAEVTVNGIKSGPLPAHLVKASTGYAEVLVTAPGYAPARRTLTLEPQLTQELFVALDPQGGTAPVPPGGPSGLDVGAGGDPGGQPGGPRLGPVRVLGIVVALAGLAAVGYGAFQTYRVSTLSSQIAKEDTKGINRGHAAEHLQWWGYGLGAAGLGGGGLLVWLGGRSSEPDRVALSLVAQPRFDGGLLSLRLAH